MARRRQDLAARREALGFTQEKLARVLGVELSTVGRWERGTLTPQPWRRQALAHALENSLEELEALLTSPSTPVTSGKLSSRREAMVDAALFTGAVVANQLVGQPSELSPGYEKLLEQASGATAVAHLVAGVHEKYQAARYGEVAKALPLVKMSVDRLVAESSASERRNAARLQGSLFIAASKLALKAGDAEGGRAAAERARVAAEDAGDAFGLAASAYQRTCALLRESRGDEAEQLAVTSAEDIRGDDPQSVTWQGALTLISSIIAARRNDPSEAERRLDHADGLARRLKTDGNIGWTAFGPTNVLIHRVSAAIALEDPYKALATAERVDITSLPIGLHGRQAQFHLDSAWAHSRLGEDPQAVIHLLDTERVAPELVQANPNVRVLIQDLLGREHRRAVPGLRGLALRAGVAA